MGSGSRRCTAFKKDGKPCRAWATIYSDPPRCASHFKSNDHLMILQSHEPPLAGLQLLLRLLDSPQR